MGRHIARGSQRRNVGAGQAPREKAEREGQEMVAGYDSEWQKKHPDAIDYYVTEFVVVALDDDGTVSEAHGV